MPRIGSRSTPAIVNYLHLHGPATVSQISRVTGKCRATVGEVLKNLHVTGTVYIESWYDARTPKYAMVLAFSNTDGPPADAPRPKRLTGSERVARCRRRKVQSNKAVSVSVASVPHLAEAPIADPELLVRDNELHPATDTDWSAILGDFDA